MIRKFFDALITGVWCFIWLVPSFTLYFIAGIFTDLLTVSKQTQNGQNTKPTIRNSSE